MNIQKILLYSFYFASGCCNLCNSGRDDNQVMENLGYSPQNNELLLFPFYNKPLVKNPNANNLRNLIYNKEGKPKNDIPLSANAPRDEYSNRFFVGVILNKQSKKWEPVIVENKNDSCNIRSGLARTKSLIEQGNMDYNEYCTVLSSKVQPYQPRELVLDIDIVEFNGDKLFAAADGSPLFIPFDGDSRDVDKEPDKDDLIQVILKMHKTSIKELQKLPPSSRPKWGILFAPKETVSPVIYNIETKKKIYPLLELISEAIEDPQLESQFPLPNDYYKKLIELAGLSNPEL